MKDSEGYRPTASLAAIQYRAKVLRDIREFFYRKEILEVDVPAIAAHTVTDPYLQPLTVELYGRRHYLQTSPEFYLKRLLASGVGSLYSMAKAYRADEKGRRHRAEFTLLEWYLLGKDDHALMAQVQELLLALDVQQAPAIISYREAFISATGINPHSQCLPALREYCAEQFGPDWHSASLNTCLDLIFSHHIEPNLQTPTFICDFPASQCALAKLGTNTFGEKIAKRFELYWQGIELANGYFELTDAKEQRARFDRDNRERQEAGIAQAQHDPKFLAAMDNGLPACAGIAMGVDRLLMCLQKTHNIAEVLAFAEF